MPDTPECQAIQPPEVKPAAGVRLIERAPEGAASCADVSAIRSGRTLMTSFSGRRLTSAAGIAPDGVKAIIWRVRRGNGFLDTRVPVRNNVYAGKLPSRAGHGLYVFWITPSAHKLVIAPHRLTKQERAQLRRERARDLATGPKPSVFPPVGTKKTIFTLRMRIERPGRSVYVATWQAPLGSACANNARNRIGWSRRLTASRRGS